MPFVFPGGGGGAGGGGLTISAVVENHSDLPHQGGSVGELIVVRQPHPSHGWMWDGNDWVDVGPIAAEGEPGQPGPAGPGVATGGLTDEHLVKRSNANFDTAWQKTEHRHNQGAAATSWVIGHNLNQQFVQVTVVSGGNLVISDIAFTSVNACTLHFDNAKAGTAIIRR